VKKREDYVAKVASLLSSYIRAFQLSTSNYTHDINIAHVLLARY